MKTLYIGKKIYPIDFLKVRTGLPCECMCCEKRTRKKLTSVRVAILRAIHWNNQNILGALHDKKRYFANVLQKYLDEQKEQTENP